MASLHTYRAGTGPTLVWLHGFTHSSHSAHQFRSILAGSHELVTLDLPGHGDSGDIRCDLTETAELVAAAIGPGPVFLGGYSFGARVALHVALAHPELVGRLVLLSGTRGIRDDVERRDRRRRDEELARRIQIIGVPAFVDEWLAQPLFAGVPNDAHEIDARNRNTASGLASSLELAGTGTQEFLGDVVRDITIPTLVMAGSLDEKFTHEALELSANLPQGECTILSGVGHAAHLENPELVASRLTAFLNQ